MSRDQTVFFLLLAAVLAAPACGSDDGGGDTAGGTTTTTTGESTTSTTDPTPEESCVRPGDKGNSKGVGEYCTPTGDECADFPEAGLCLAKVGQDQWMCTRIGCDETTDCGEDAGCVITGDGSACVPCRCEAGIGCPGAGGSGGTGGSSGSGGAGGTAGGGGM